MFNFRQAKMEKYYALTNKSLAYIATLILDLNLKQKYIKSNQKQAQITKAKVIIDNFQEEYKFITFVLALTLAISIALKPFTKNAFLVQKKRY